MDPRTLTVAGRHPAPGGLQPVLAVAGVHEEGNLAVSHYDR